MLLNKCMCFCLLATATVNGIVYQGCYEDSTKRVLPTRLPDSPTNTPADCARRCSSYRYAGVEYKTQCFCGNTLEGSQKPESECNHTCLGDPSKMCGGEWRIGVYTNWACGPPPTIANGITALRKGINITYGSFADVYCDPGFVGKNEITCLSTKSWEKATCEHEGSMTTFIAAGVSVAVAVAVAAFVVVFVLRRKQLLPCSKTKPTSNIGKHTFEIMPEQSYEDLVDRNENTTNYCVLDIESGAADATLRYYNIEGCQNNESPKTNDNCNYEYYNSMVAHEN